MATPQSERAPRSREHRIGRLSPSHGRRQKTQRALLVPPGFGGLPGLLRRVAVPRDTRFPGRRRRRSRAAPPSKSISRSPFPRNRFSISAGPLFGYETLTFRDLLGGISRAKEDDESRRFSSMSGPRASVGAMPPSSATSCSISSPRERPWSRSSSTARTGTTSWRRRRTASSSIPAPFSICGGTGRSDVHSRSAREDRSRSRVRALRRLQGRPGHVPSRRHERREPGGARGIGRYRP